VLIVAAVRKIASAVARKKPRKKKPKKRFNFY